jgi:hypothetical protein
MPRGRSLYGGTGPMQTTHTQGADTLIHRGDPGVRGFQDLATPPLQIRAEPSAELLFFRRQGKGDSTPPAVKRHHLHGELAGADGWITLGQFPRRFYCHPADRQMVRPVSDGPRRSQNRGTGCVAAGAPLPPLVEDRRRRRTPQ